MKSSEIHQQSLRDSVQKELDRIGIDFVLTSRDLNNNNLTSESKQSELTELTADSSASEKIKLLQQHIDDVTISADQRLHLKQLQTNHQSSSLSIGESSSVNNNINNNNKCDKLGYQLRALKEDISALESNPWVQAPTLPQIINISSLSNELVNETLNYFVNCGQRLSQMTKTYDDNDAYVLLLQEKEVDLELAARIGQDLLKQNKQLRDSIKSLEDELNKRRDDVQQLRHELVSKTTLLDTFIEEEEQQQASFTESEDETTFRQRDGRSALNRSSTISSNNTSKKLFSSQAVHQPQSQLDNNDEDCSTSGFLSLNYSHQKPYETVVEPFSSLPHHLSQTPLTESSKRQLSVEDLASSIGEDSHPRQVDNQGLIHTVTFQLVESNKRLCELQDELSYKGEQNLLQQEKIYRLEEQLRESDRRLGEIATENESLHTSIIESARNHKELTDELKACRHNFNELLRVFVELQNESRAYRMRSMQRNSSTTFMDEFEPIMDDNALYDPFSNNASSDPFNNPNLVRPSYSGANVPMSSSSLLKELQESMQKKEDCSDSGDATADESDSGVHTHPNNMSASITPSTNGQVTDSDEGGGVGAGGRRSARVEEEEEEDKGKEEEGSASPLSDFVDKRNWLGFSSFMLTTLLLVCLSATFTSSSNSNLAQKLQIKLDR